MLEFYISLLFVILGILLFIGFIIYSKKSTKKWMYFSFAIVSLITGILLFTILDWEFPGADPGDNNGPPVTQNGDEDKEPQNGTKDPLEPGEPDPTDPEPGEPEPEPDPEPKDPEQPEHPQQPVPEKITIPADGVVDYEVVKGDTLYSISKRADVTVAKIKLWNNLSSDTIYIGQILKLYGKNNEPATPPPSPTEPGGDSPSQLIVRGNQGQKEIAFTFDAGSGIEGIEILNVLKKHNVKATFFLTGKWVEKFPDYAKRIVNEGHEIGNHTFSHPDAVKTDSYTFSENIKIAEQKIKSVTGISPRPYFRFPYGSYNKAALETVGKAGYKYSIHWSLDTIDWQQPTADVIVQRIMSKASNGDIILMHIGGINTPKAVDRVIPMLKNEGYRLVTLTEVLN